jgi:hypothetical protein
VAEKTTQDVEIISASEAANFELINAFGRYVRNDGYIMILPLTVLAQASGTTSFNIRIQQYIDKSIKIQYRAYATVTNSAVVYATIQYTKTTD